MDELNLYQGAYTGTEIDQCIGRIYATPRNGSIPFIWKMRLNFTIAANTPYPRYSYDVEFPTPPTSEYQYYPNLDNCEVLNVEPQERSSSTYDFTFDCIKITGISSNKFNIYFEFAKPFNPVHIALPVTLDVYLVENPQLVTVAGS